MLEILPVEVWQEVLGFCPFEEYVRLAGFQSDPEEEESFSVVQLEREEPWEEELEEEGAGEEEEEPGKCRAAPSREFYFLLKVSLLEMRFSGMLPSALLGGLWAASRGLDGRYIRKLRLGEC